VKWAKHDDPVAFAARVIPFLSQREAAHNLQLGILGRMAEGKAPLRGDADAKLFLASWENDRGDISAVALHTSPQFSLILTDHPDGAAEALCAIVGESIGDSLHGVVGPAESSIAFAESWSRRGQIALKATPHHRVRAYELTNIARWPTKVEGEMSALQPGDPAIAMVEQWTLAFGREIHEPVADVDDYIARLVGEQRLFIWRDGSGTPVAMAALGSTTPNGVRVNLVFTPPELRGRGYASNLVAHMSQHALDAGRRFCFLFADTENPTSTGIYMKMGYAPVCDYAHFKFQRPPDKA
jgi:predicted GNAT family acetyltransferase